jgi:hypothetical protein
MAAMRGPTPTVRPTPDEPRALPASVVRSWIRRDDDSVLAVVGDGVADHAEVDDL